MSYWRALLMAPMVVGLGGIVLERLLLSQSSASITFTGCC